MSFSSGERLDVLDGLRGLAILLVVWYHAWLVSGQGVPGLNFVAEAGFLGVDLFFFISGFCLYFPYARAKRDGRPAPTTRHFFYRRAVKILPSYLLALVVFAIVYHARFASPIEAVIQLVSHATFVHTLFPLTYGAISGPLWTIGVEVQFYVIFPLLCPLFRKAPLWTFGLLILSAETYRLVIGHAGLSSSFLFCNQLPAFLDVFGSGLFAAHVFCRLSRREQHPRVLHTLASLGAFALAAAGLVAVSEIARRADSNVAYDWVNAGRVFIGPLGIVLAVSTSFAFSHWRRLVSARVFVFFSMISYNLYLWNLEIAVWYHQAGFNPAATLVLGIATAVLLATGLTYAVERPLLDANYRAIWAAFLAHVPGHITRPHDGASDAGSTA